MARTLKGTRARGLPAKVLLSQRQDATGSFPTVWRTSSDNRTGKYPVFFNDNKVINFNQPVTDVGLFVSTYPEYEEKVVTVGSSGNPVNYVDVVFDYSFTNIPVLVITDLTSNTNTPNVNAFVKEYSITGSYINFSAPFEGTIVYRALYQATFGTPVNVLRSPRYTNQYSLVVADYGTLLNENNKTITFSDFGSVPTNNYVTFWDYGSNTANVSASITYVGNTSVVITSSATVSNAEVDYMGFGTSTATVDVKGIVYPLVMTPQAIDAGLTTEAKNDLYKQPYFSGSVIVNQPIVASGSMVNGVSDIFVTFTPGQDIEPFMDFANPEVDGKVSASVGGINPFYATGSAVTVTGLGFQQPLWSKNKIEIDITPATVQTIGADIASLTDHYPMCYWNTTNKQYDGVGSGVGVAVLGNTLSDLKTYLSGQAVGFGASLGPGGSSLNDLEQDKAMGYPISNFGYPYDPKFQPNQNQQLMIGDYISEPFLLEKIVVEISCSIQTNGITSGGGSNTAIWNFFILNSRNDIPNKIFGEQTINCIVPGSAGSFSSFVTSSISSGKISDLVTFAQVSLYDPINNIRGPVRDQIVPITRTASYSYWNGQLILSASIRNPIGYNKGLLSGFGSSFSYLEDLRLSGRSQVNEINGRDWKNAFTSPNIIGTYYNPSGGGINIPVLEAYKINNPYLLLPKDKLTFGWHMPYKFNDEALVNQSNMSFFPAGINKIILYGSTLRVNPETNQLEEHHDTLNQLLCSNSIHETIG